MKRHARGGAPRAFFVAAALFATSSIPHEARADDLPTEPERLYYKGYDYGSQSLYNPVSVLLNRGFDTLQLRPPNRSMWGQPMLTNLGNVVDNLTSPGRAIRLTGGFGRFARTELLPLTWERRASRWVPNYTLHLIGGGQTYRQLTEWYDAHDAPLPAAWSIGTLYLAAFTNEAIENQNVEGPNTDAIADLLIFDLAGILFFSINPVARFFAHTVMVMDWSLQPAFTSLDGTLHNVGNYYAMKVPMPFHHPLRLFAYAGYATEFGLSYKIGEYSLSAAGGVRFSNFLNAGEGAVVNTVNTRAAGAIFFDRNDSLLASIQIADVTDYFVNANVYPNAFFKSDFGFFFVASRDLEHFAGGISYRHALGFGLGTSSLIVGQRD